MEEFEWNELVYSAKFSFEPVIGEIYHLYQTPKDQFSFFDWAERWNKEHIGTFNSIAKKMDTSQCE
jgi:hypothetical protein